MTYVLGLGREKNERNVNKGGSFTVMERIRPTKTSGQGKNRAGRVRKDGSAADYA